MADDEKARAPLEESEGANEAPSDDASDRAVALAVRVGLPILTVAAALTLGFLTSIGPALLALVTGVLLGAIALLWASLRSLVGDAELDPALDEAAAIARAQRGGLRGERKRIALRALKDLEHEHSIGKIDDDDYERLVTHYRAEAKAAMREIDEEIEPFRAKAEALAREHLEKRAPQKKAGKKAAVAKKAEVEPDPEALPAPVAAVPEPAAEPIARPRCGKCGTRNDADAAFCKKCGKVLKEPPPDEDEDEDEARP